ncbi:hypothetical protein DCC85_17795 [Paenibacillus sp. CAA11]|uniref:helix-turn-helix domain-containing protein n=1 Tax=Paenibacillus sp. CAA11 TaxID=1532905 RepID=UPI000D384162|nr:helix-turn-helix transcriptional regulator [Paenibacillus sp. CAA11]AWB45857.1 hypothetical protein DCC85_17795 [Paenibacillus sp. CAA11]
MTTIGAKIRQLRKQQGLTQTALAGTHMTKSMLSQIENGRALPSMRSLQYLAERLGQDAGYFLEEDGRLVTELVAKAEREYKKKAYAKIIRLVQSEAPAKLPMTVDAARLMILYANACFHTSKEGGESAIGKAVEIYERFGLYIESAKAKYTKYAHLFIQEKYVPCLELINEVRAQYASKRIDKDTLFEIDLYYAEAITLSALGQYEQSKQSMLAAIELSKEKRVYYMTGDFYRILAGNMLLFDRLEDCWHYLAKARQFAEFTENPVQLGLLELSEARAANREHRYAEAMDYIVKCAQHLDKKNGSYYVHKGIAHYGLGQEDLALEAFAEVTPPEGSYGSYHPLDRSEIYAADAYAARIHASRGEDQLAKELAAKAYMRVHSFPESPFRKFILATYEEVNRL